MMIRTVGLALATLLFDVALMTPGEAHGDVGPDIGIGGFDIQPPSAPPSGQTLGYSPVVIPVLPGPHTFSEPEVPFDIDGDGDLELVAWPEQPKKIAFLAVDRNGDGLINNGTELFGNFTLPGVNNGFIALTRLAEVLAPAGAALEREHPYFDGLLLWHDLDRNGVSEPGELVPAKNVLQSIGLGFLVPVPKADMSSELRCKGWAEFREDALQRASPKVANVAGEIIEVKAPRKGRPIYEVFLVTQP